jgi:hypothetical protein
MSAIKDLFQEVGSWLAGLAGLGMAHAPVLAIGLALLALVPVLMLVGWAMRRSHRDDDVVTRHHRAEEGTGPSPDSTAGPVTLAWHRPARPARVVSLVIVGDGPQQGRRFAVSSRAMTRIGRESDNDICLEDTTVHRYHAVIRRSPEEGLVIADVSGGSGNGVTHNGRRVASAHLADRDMIVLGKITLRVEMT